MAESAKVFFNDISDQWVDHYEDKNDKFTNSICFIQEFISSHVDKCRLLDVGCNAGLLVELMLKDGYDAYGCDIADVAVKNAQNRLAKIVDDSNERIRVSTPDKIPFDENFELVSAIEVFPYLPDYNIFLDNLSAKLKPGGFICAQSLNRYSIYSMGQVLYSLLHGNIRVAMNLFRTGLWDGGFVDPAKSKQCHSAGSFDSLFAKCDFERIAWFGTYFFRPLDKSPLSRNWLGRFLVRYFGWNYNALYKKRS